MKIIKSLKKLIKRIHIADRRTKNLSRENTNTTNPFGFVQNKTYVWLERVNDYNYCKYNNDK